MPTVESAWLWAPVSPSPITFASTAHTPHDTTAAAVYNSQRGIVESSLFERSEVREQVTQLVRRHRLGQPVRHERGPIAGHPLDRRGGHTHFGPGRVTQHHAV